MIIISKGITVKKAEDIKILHVVFYNKISGVFDRKDKQS
jgi:hypothetical protein